MCHVSALNGSTSSFHPLHLTCAFSSLIKDLLGNYLQQCWQLKIFEKYYFTLKKERSGRDKRIQQKREAREKRNGSDHWLWDTARKGSQTQEKGQRNKAGFPPESTRQPLFCTSALPCHQNQVMAWFISSHKPDLIFTLVKNLKYWFLPVSESRL